MDCPLGLALGIDLEIEPRGKSSEGLPSQDRRGIFSRGLGNWLSWSFANDLRGMRQVDIGLERPTIVPS